MFAKFIILLLISKVVTAQIDGSFWWMNEKLAKYRTVPPPPKFEELSELDTDESAKIVFRDNDLDNSYTKFKVNHGKVNDKLKIDVLFQDKSELSWPVVKTTNLELNNEKATNKEGVSNVNRTDKTHHVNADVFDFKFPENENFLWEATSMKIPVLTSDNISFDSKASVGKKVPVKIRDPDTTQVESICKFMKNFECINMKGFVYVKHEKFTERHSSSTRLICCILPLSTDESTKIHFLDTPHKLNHRYKRSSKDESINPALNQRNFLLKQKYATLAHVVKPTAAALTKVTQKFGALDEDYADPYWNIKNSNPKIQRQNQQNNNKYQYNNDDYVEDYVVEIPKPGLVRIYSDHGNGEPSWSFSSTGSSYGGPVDCDEGDSGTSFGYGATIDPRLEDRITATISKTPRPVIRQKLTTASSEEIYNAEGQTVSYQSNPDFQVLQGFKLLNLVRNRSRIYKHEKKTSNTDSVVESDSKESVLIGSLEADYGDYIDKNQQVYKNCGKIANYLQNDHVQGKQTGEAEKGSHPWLALVVLTRKRQTILCYATLVHDRAALTAADCVRGRTTAGEITLIAGAWDLDEENSEGWQRRMASVYLDHQHQPGEIAYDLAVLHWKRPLRFGASIRPACLADPHVGDECKFFGWGGYDQAIRPHSRWQQASVLTPRACRERLSPSMRANLPSDVFCASVHSRGTVTGIGGSLICNIGGRHNAVGVAVWRDSSVLLAPAHEWTVQAINALHLH